MITDITSLNEYMDCKLERYNKSNAGLLDVNFNFHSSSFMTGAANVLQMAGSQVQEASKS